jgi:hypothetical protein
VICCVPLGCSLAGFLEDVFPLLIQPSLDLAVEERHERLAQRQLESAAALRADCINGCG